MTDTLARPTAARPRPRPGAASVATAGLLAVTACVLALVLTGGVPESAPAGLPDAGAVTGWGLRLVAVLSTLAAVGTTGSLLVAAVLVPARADGHLAGPARSAATAAGRWSTAWAVLATCELLLVSSDIAGVPVSGLDAVVVSDVAATGPGRALCTLLVVTTLLGAAARRTETTSAARLLLAVALAALVPGAVVAHGASAADHHLVTSAAIVHVVAAAAWAGGLAGLVLHLRHHPAALAAAAARYSPLALGAYAALACSGVIAAWTRLGPEGSAWSSTYGALVVAKVAALVALGALGHRHRRRTLPRLADGDRGPFLRLAGVELALMGAATGLAAALSRTPVPTPEVDVAPAHGTGHPTLPADVQPISLTELATAWRADAVVLVVLGLALAAYLSGVRLLRRHGRSWPRRRTAAYVGGIGLALVDLCSGMATYAPAMVSVQVAQLLVLLLAVPALLLLGAPAALALEADRARGTSTAAHLLGSRAAGAAASPFTGAVVVCALLLVVYRTPLIEVSQRSSWAHLVVLALALLGGLLLLWPALGAPGRIGPSGAEWSWCMAGVAGCLGVLAVQLSYGDRLLAAEWFLELRWGWVDPAADQRLAGGLAALATAAVLVLAVAVRARRRPA